ncbi:MAG: patatin-like phospholipase family protein [Bryobacterales bacterium]|nr:patatin-like phospholipase family protein [Bryobacterales bacterium]
MKRALVLSGGGLFGAWQVGAWSRLREDIRFDTIIGASIGSLNGWAIAGGAAPEQLSGKWKDAAAAGHLRFRFPRRPLDGIVDSSQIEGFIRDVHSSFTPCQEYYAVLTDLLRLRPQMIAGDIVGWRHLAASCALLGLLPQQRIDRVLYTDGGFLGALPLWAAARCDASLTVGLNVMPRMPWPVRAALKPLRAIRGRPSKPARDRILVLAPSRSLGTWREAFLWQRARVAEWICRGYDDAHAALRDSKHFH